jgi:hypothetical protein
LPRGLGIVRVQRHWRAQWRTFTPQRKRVGDERVTITVALYRLSVRPSRRLTHLTLQRTESARRVQRAVDPLERRV